MIKILVVEDEAITAMDIQSRLQGLGYSVPDTASSGEKAITLAEQHKPDLVLMDIVLQGEMDGTVAGKYISDILHIPIVFLTAFKDKDTVNRAKLSDPYGYITKPFETVDLQIAIELALFKHDMITARQKAEKELLYLSQHDILTSLYNRSAFTQAIQKEMRKIKQDNTILAILLIDLDNFKLVNDNYGHHVGDQLLIAVAKQITNTVRTDDFVARLGGDEFIIILTNIKSVADVHTIAKNLTNCFNKPFKIEDHYFHATVSIGVAVAPAFGNDEHSLMKNADIALYFVKEQGRNNYQFFSDEIYNSFKLYVQLETEMHIALDKNQFYLVYQPQYSLPNKKVSGMEVLLRWQHPELGVLMSEDFLSIAEKNGMIIPINEWALTHACKQFMEWRSQHLIADNLTLSITLSPTYISKDNFIYSFKDILDSTEMLPAYLELEFTETSVMTSGINLDPIFKKLKAIGVKISINDFGKGYSSLSRLKTLPISKLKIDKSFIGNIEKNADDATIVKSIIALGISLGLKVNTGGVETQEQLNFLIKYHCSVAQGLYFEKHPLNRDEMTRLLKVSEAD